MLLLFIVIELIVYYWASAKFMLLPGITTLMSPYLSLFWLILLNYEWGIWLTLTWALSSASMSISDSSTSSTSLKSSSLFFKRDLIGSLILMSGLDSSYLFSIGELVDCDLWMVSYPDFLSFSLEDSLFSISGTVTISATDGALVLEF